MSVSEYEAIDPQANAEDSAEEKPLSIIRSEDSPTALRLQLQFHLPNDSFWKKQTKLLFYALAVLCGLVGNSIWQFERDFEEGAFWLWLAFLIWLVTEAYDQRALVVAWWKGHDRLKKARWLARLLPLGIGVSGALLMVESMSAEEEAVLGLLEVALSRFAIALLLLVVIEVAAWWLRRRARSDSRLAGWRAPQEPVDVITEPAQRESRSRLQVAVQILRRELSKVRIALLVLAAISSLALWQDADDNRVSGAMIALWFINAGLWAAVFAPTGANPFHYAHQRWGAFRRIQWLRHKGTLLALAFIMVLGASFRLTQLNEIPQDMFVDHIEKITDAYRVSQGEYEIFYSNNGGREPIHMHLIAALAALPGFGFNFFTLKFLSAIISLLTLPVLYWMAVELLGEERRELAVAAGLMLTGLFAVSWAHVFITREGLRFVLPPLFSAVFMVYAARALRRNQRSDYVKVGLTIGFGLYAYQSLRIMPLVFVAIIVVALLVRQISWRERALYVFHLAVAGLIAFMVFLPMFRFMLIWPQNFWRRTMVSMAGYGVANEDILSVIVGNLTALMQNIRDAMLMFNWRGDHFPWKLLHDSPEMDILAGSFLIVGLAAWLVRTLRSRDPVMWAVPVAILILLLPSALGVASPWLENPNYARASGAFPLVYLLAALPFGIIALRLLQTMPRPVALALATLLFTGVILFANHRNTENYFKGWLLHDVSSNRRTPYSEAGKYLRGFVDSGGAFGNAFLISVPHGWDHRILAMEAGEMPWRNSVYLPDLPQRLSTALVEEQEYPLNPERALLFFYVDHDEESPKKLREYFPTGYALEMVTYNDLVYHVFHVPPMGLENLFQFVIDHGGFG